MKVHHIVVGFMQPTLGGNFCSAISLYDVNTPQCTIQFLANGTILFYAGALNASPTILATYTPSTFVLSTWYAFEFEVVIHNTAGAFRVRRNGNPVNDFDSGAVLNTRTSANNYANAIALGQTTNGPGQYLDDFFWQSGAAAGKWLGDVGCITLMPYYDAQAAMFSHFPVAQIPYQQLPRGNAYNMVGPRATYSPFTVPWSGTVGSISIPINVASSANFKAAIYSSVSGLPTIAANVPGVVLATATPIAGASVGTLIFNFPTPLAVTAGTQYFFAFSVDIDQGNLWCRWNYWVS
jgi:hypothetical protein